MSFPRFERSVSQNPLQLTERDREIINLVHQHRFLRSIHVISLLGGSPQGILRRLQLLYHHGYLERPRAQLEYYHQGGSKPMVYGLGNKGAKLLQTTDVPPLDWNEKNRWTGRLFLEHALFVSDIMVTLELACRQNQSVKFIAQNELSITPFRWKINLGNGFKIGVVPDQTFALEFQTERGQPKRIHFFLEADRGTMPVMRSTLTQSSFYRKLLAYQATWRQAIPQKRFGFQRFRVMTVTTRPERVISLINACAQLKNGQGLFLFADRSILNDLFSSIWKSGRNGEHSGLLD